MIRSANTNFMHDLITFWCLRGIKKWPFSWKESAILQPQRITAIRPCRVSQQEQHRKSGHWPKNGQGGFVRNADLSADRSESPLSALHVAMLRRNEAVPVRVFQSRRQPCTRPLVFANKFSAPMACPKMHEVYLQQIAPQNSKAFPVAWFFVSVCI